jgi:L-lysine exporter family protein LysE/ArgO
MELLISGFLLSLSLCLDIGIVNIAIIKTGIEKGFKQSFIIGLGSTVGDMVYAVSSVIGITLILQFIYIRWAIWILGTLVLIYLCWQTIIHIFKPIDTSKNEAEIQQDKKTGQYFLNGLGLALSSPSAIIWFATVGGSVLATQNHGNKCSLLMFLFGFFAASVIWSVFLAYISFKGGQMMKDKIKKIFSIISALIFLLLAVYVFWDGFNSLINSTLRD